VFWRGRYHPSPPFFGDSDDLNIYFGPQNDDLLTVTSVDLFRADAMIANGWVKFTGIEGKTADATLPARGTTPIRTLYGGEFGTDKLIPMGNLAVLLLHRADPCGQSRAWAIIAQCGRRARQRPISSPDLAITRSSSQISPQQQRRGTPGYMGTLGSLVYTYGHDLKPCRSGPNWNTAAVRMTSSRSHLERASA